MVPGEGAVDAAIMFVGEAPGRQEDKMGRPFVGRSGKFFDELLDGIGLRRGDVFIVNVLKCRPRTPSGKDRKPRVGEISACAPYLNRQIEIIRPRIICAMGDTASTYILEKHGFKPRKIGEMHGKIFQTDTLKIMPTYHPAAGLYTYGLRGVMKRDFEKLGAQLRRSIQEQ